AGFAAIGSGVLTGSGSTGAVEHPASSATRIESRQKRLGSRGVRRNEDSLMLFTFLLLAFTFTL
ncbi:MAG: hypothetical protein HOB98_15555, partial [Gammaproteobacteria bacterium]|nr:hypothetical protein [Gammaproteobacteria bacterium]